MGQVRQETYKAITDNDMDQVLFSDPFGDVTRKVKRNLLVAGFVCLLISVLNLEISGFLGLKATNMNLGNEIAKGLAFFITLYFLVSFMFHVYIDYVAWCFQKEKQQTKPYYDLVHLIESQINVTGEQIHGAVSKLDKLCHEKSVEAQVSVMSDVKSARQQLEAITASLSSVVDEMNPLISSWKTTIGKMDKLSLRLKVRFVSLWGLDMIFPFVVACIALYKSYSGVPELVTKLMT